MMPPMMGAMPGLMPGMMPGMMQGLLPGMQGLGAQPQKQKVDNSPKDFLNLKFGDDFKEKPIDPDVRALMIKVEINDTRLMKLLNEEIMKRKDTKESWLAKLEELLEDMGDPGGYLEMKIEEMRKGEFVGNILEIPEVDALAREWGLSETAKQKINQMMSMRGTKRGSDIVRLEKICEHAQNKSEVAITLANQVIDGKLENLPDMAEAEDVMKKFRLDDEATRKLVQVVLQRADDSSRVLGRLEVYLETCKRPSDAVRTMFGRLMAGGDVPDEHKEPKDTRREEDRDGSKDRDRDRDRRGRDRDRDRRGRSRSRSRGRRSRSRRR